MERLAMVEKLIKKTNISYEEAKNALEKNKWDILDAIVYLEKHKIIASPEVEIYASNSEEIHSEKEIKQILSAKEEQFKENKKSEIFEKFFEWICRVIDKGNNIFLQIKRNERVLVKVPLTVLIVCFFFTFSFIIPILILGLFINIEYEIIGNNINKDKINKFLSYLSECVKELKQKNKKGDKNE